MNSQKLTPRMVVASVALLMIAVSCSPAKPQLPDGVFTVGPSGDQTETTLAAGRYESRLVGVLSTSVVEEGTFVVKDDQITFTQEKATGANLVACGSTAKPYSYKWAYDQQAKTITLVNVDDSCSVH